MREPGTRVGFFRGDGYDLPNAAVGGVARQEFPMTLHKICFATAFAIFAVHAHAQAAPTSTATTLRASIAVTGENDKTLTLDFAALDKMPQRRVYTEAHGHKSDCRGASLIDVLAEVGAPHGEKLRGKDLALYVRALPEFVNAQHVHQLVQLLFYLLNRFLIANGLNRHSG